MTPQEIAAGWGWMWFWSCLVPSLVAYVVLIGVWIYDRSKR